MKYKCKKNFKILVIYRTNIRYYDNEQRSTSVALKLGHIATYRRFTSYDATHRLRTATIIGNKYVQDYKRSSIRGIKHMSEAKARERIKRTSSCNMSKWYKMVCNTQSA